MRRCFALFCLMSGLGACGHDPVGLPGAQGIIGSVLIGPMCPVQTVQDPCPDQPYQAWIHVLSSSGEWLTSVRSDTDGSFMVGLRPGTYRVGGDGAFARAIRHPIAPEQEVVVERGSFTDVVVHFDTGIR